jgi:hypothetical protein
MTKNIFVFLALVMSIASATFLEQTLTTAGTDQSFSTLVTTSQLGNNTYASFNSTNASDNQTITIKYMSGAPNYNQHTLTYSLTGTTAAVTSGLGYAYLVKGATTVSENKNSTVSSTNATSYYSLTTTHQPLRLAVHNVTIGVTGNSQDALNVYLNGANIANISAGGTTSNAYTSKNVLNTNNITIVRPTNNNFTETKSNVTLKTGTSGSQSIVIANTPLALTANVTVYGDIPTNGVATVSNVTKKTGGSGTQNIVFTQTPSGTGNLTVYADIPAQEVETVTNDTAVNMQRETVSLKQAINDTGGNGTVTLTVTNQPVVRLPTYQYGAYLTVNASNVTAGVLAVTLNGHSVGTINANGSNIWARNQSVEDEMFYVGVNNITITGDLGVMNVSSVDVEYSYVSGAAVTSGAHEITIGNTSTGGNLTISLTKTGTCPLSVTFNGVWQGNLTGATALGTWTLAADEAKVGVNNLTYSTDGDWVTGCTAVVVDNATIESSWEKQFNLTFNGALVAVLNTNPTTLTGLTIIKGTNTVAYSSTDTLGNLTNSTIVSAYTEGMNVSLNGVLMGAFATSPSTWTGKTVTTGANTVSFTSTHSTANLTNSTIKVLYNSPPIITYVGLDNLYFNDTKALTFTMDDDSANWSLTSLGNGNNSTPCANYSRVVRIVGTSLAYTTDATITSRSVLTNSDDGTTASLNDAAIQNIYIDNNTYLTELWYKDTSGNRIVAAPFRLAYCKNATLTSNTSTSDVTTTQYTRSGSITAAINDIAYIWYAKLSSAATGNVTISDVAGTVIYTILKGATQPVDNGGSNMCISATGCTVSNLFYGGDALYKMTARVFAHDGTNSTAFSTFQAAGTGNYGDGIVKYSAGERVVFYGLPYTSATNVTLNYEVK